MTNRELFNTINSEGNMRKSIKFGTSLKREIFDRLERAKKIKNYKKSSIIEIALTKLFNEWKIK